MLKPRIAIGFGLVLFMATMIGRPVRVSQAQDDGGVTLASLAGKFAARGGGFQTVCFNTGFTALEDCATAPHLVPFNFTQIQHVTRGVAGNGCSVATTTNAPVFGTKFPSVGHELINVSNITSFDPATGSGTGSSKGYDGGSCNGAVFDSTGATQVNTTTFSFDVSDSGNRIETITTGFTAVTSAFSLAGSVNGVVFSQTAIRLQPQD
jgi:hypothetical protein